MQGGNNNVYCQDKETSWFDWSLASKDAACADGVGRASSNSVKSITANLTKIVALTVLIGFSSVLGHAQEPSDPKATPWASSPYMFGDWGIRYCGSVIADGTIPRCVALRQ
jgi:pullulanase/glycogen debranching enzyme